MSLVVVRHAPTRAAGWCVGRSEVEVEIGHDEAARAIVATIGEAGHAPARVWSSPITRCAGPAQLVSTALGIEHRADPRLAEIDHGRFEGRGWSELERDEGAALARWMERWIDEGPPGGESARDVEARVRTWWSELPEEPALLIAHAGVARALRVIIDGLAWPEAMSIPVPHLLITAVHARR